MDIRMTLSMSEILILFLVLLVLLRPRLKSLIRSRVYGNNLAWARKCTRH
jgi:hypothetical protein